MPNQPFVLSPSIRRPFVLRLSKETACYSGRALSKDTAGLLRKDYVEGLPVRSVKLVEVQGSKRARSETNMSFWVYILRCVDNSYYTGHTDNLEERIAKHQAGEIEGYTSTRLPLRLIFSEAFPTREEALACERQIKGWSRRKKEALMRGDWAEVSRLARRGHPVR